MTVQTIQIEKTNEPTFREQQEEDSEQEVMVPESKREKSQVELKALYQQQVSARQMRIEEDRAKSVEISRPNSEQRPDTKQSNRAVSQVVIPYSNHSKMPLSRSVSNQSYKAQLPGAQISIPGT